MALVQPPLIYPVVMGFVLVDQSFVTCAGVMALTLKNIYNGLLIDQNVKNDRSLHSSACLKEIPTQDNSTKAKKE